MQRWLLLVVLAISLPARADDFDALVDSAKFIFTGDVLRLGASTMPSVPPSPNTAVVRVNRVLTGARLLDGFEGREITVTMRQPSRMTNVFFFTNVKVWGQSLAVEEVVPARAEAGGDIAAAVRRNAQRVVDEKKAKAAVIVEGVVAEVRLPKRRPLTEHDPMWAVAVVQVRRVLKGSAGPTVEVVFASSNDEMWRKSPKYAVGDSATFILERTELGLVAR